jgi:tetratricopeptide (TPR) repeat protein
MNALANSFSAVAQALVFAGVTALVLLSARVVVSLWRRIRTRNHEPIIVEAVRHGSDDESGVLEPFVDMLRTYIAEDVHGVWTHVPGAPNLATPDIPTEPPMSLDGWLGNLYRITVASRPGFYVTVAQLPSDHIRISVQIVRNPGGHFIGARTFEAAQLNDVAFAVGGYCVERVQQQHKILRRTPRWEQWANRGGYDRFRQGLYAEQQGDTTQALKLYDLAGTLSLGNVTLALRRAGILEQQQRQLEAIQVYYYCQTLWPESIEATYRYAATCSNLRDVSGRAYRSALDALRSIQASLRYQQITKKWLSSILSRRKNAGERRYWANWLRPWTNPTGGPFSRRSKRRTFLYAVKVALDVVALSSATATPVPPPGSFTGQYERVGALLGRKRIGWLAHYNGACFYAICASMPPSYFRSYKDASAWTASNIDLALCELASVVRDPHNRLDPQWVLVDPDLTAIRNSSAANHWASFLGIDLFALNEDPPIRRWGAPD